MADPVQVVTPHLIVNDANAAIEFYKSAFGASEVMRMPAQDGKRLMHSEINVNGGGGFVVGDFSQHRGGAGGGGGGVSPPPNKGTSGTTPSPAEKFGPAGEKRAGAARPSSAPPRGPA